MVKWVKPTSDMTPARPETAARLGNAAQATKRAAEGIRGELELSRIQRSKQQQLGWPGLSAASTSAAAGVRAHSETRLRWPWGGVLGSYGTCAAR